MARPGQAPVPPGADHLFQLRGRVRAAGLRRQGQRPGPAFRGQSRAPRIEGSQLREGPGHPEPDVRPGEDPAPAAQIRPARLGQMGAGLLGGSARRHSLANPAGASRGPSRRDHVPRGTARRGRLHGTRPPLLGGGRAQQPQPTSAHREPAPATPCGWATTAPPPTSPTPGSSSCFPPSSNPVTTSTPTPNGSSRLGRPGGRWPPSIRASPTPRRCPTTGSRHGPVPRRRCCWP